jgi:hypothetical protein
MIHSQPLFHGMPDPPNGTERLHWAWDRLVKSALPVDFADSADPGKVDQQVADWAGVEVHVVQRVRLTRNKCGHPYSRGWPGQAELDLALESAQEIWLAHESKAQAQRPGDDSIRDYELLMSQFYFFGNKQGGAP